MAAFFRTPSGQRLTARVEYHCAARMLEAARSGDNPNCAYRAGVAAGYYDFGLWLKGMTISGQSGQSNPTGDSEGEKEHES